MKPVSLKWWHFEDEEGYQKLSKETFFGNFYPNKCYSMISDWYYYWIAKEYM